MANTNLTSDDHWSATFKPENHLLNKQKFNVVVAADGKRNTLQGMFN